MSRALTSLLALLCVTLTAAAQIALKAGVSAPALRELLLSRAPLVFLTRAMAAPLVLAGLAIYTLSVLLWLMVLAKADVSFAYPFVGVGFVLIAIYGHLVLHESLLPARIAGIVLITLGVICIARS